LEGVKQEEIIEKGGDEEFEIYSHRMFMDEIEVFSWV
jgi:hypothetical protein